MRVPIRKPGKYTHSKSDPRLTTTKLTELQEKLQKLKKIQPRAAEEVKSLSEGGDFSDNAGYAMAKGRLRGINQRILELEDQIRYAEVISPPKDALHIQLGHRVTIEIAGKQETYHMLGSTEANPAQGIISHNSPIGSALMGHRVGDDVTFQSATKRIACRIVKIE
ncbi:MAG: GreA/GreB family elongation factor [Patescibacteria group bacterium]|jgi:transcription elongation factor GreA